MVSIISALIIILLILLFTIFAAWIDSFGAKRKEVSTYKTVEKVIDKICVHSTSKLFRMIEEYKTGPWYLVVYKTTQGYPIWISHNNIRSVHPDAENCRLIIKLFNGEDMVIDDVESYKIQAANKMADYDM